MLVSSDINKDWTCKDKDKDLTHKDQDQDKDLNLVLKESLRTRTRTSLTVPYCKLQKPTIAINQKQTQSENSQHMTVRLHYTK